MNGIHRLQTAADFSIIMITSGSHLWYMKSTFILITVFIYPMLIQKHQESFSRSTNYENVKKEDSIQSIRIINESSLKRLPVVVKDLSIALRESDFRKNVFLSEDGFTVHLFDVTCKSFENAAAVRYQQHDTMYQLKLNRFNKQATDIGLAVTLIHEIMHCVLLDICKRAKEGDAHAIVMVNSFGLPKKDSSNFFSDDFFTLMNSGDEGQHELIYHLLYPRMVSLLERFATIHGQSFFNPDQPTMLMWSGLQHIKDYKKLKKEERRNIELEILDAKGVHLEEE